ncbi:MAG TPA: PEP-CTERM sorting domain-containing protein [Verrucomicrobiae bacterium]
MKLYSNIICILTAGMISCFSQGFINLDFESAVINPDPSSPYYPYAVYDTNAMPGWTAYINGSPQQDIIYNTRPLDAAAVTLQGTNSVLTPIQGNFTVELFGSSMFAPQQSAAIGQTAQIPAFAMSLIFWGNIGGLQITFNNQPLAFNSIGSTDTYTIWSADVSAYAGQTGQLVFTVPWQSSALLDSIQFSSSPVPEPSALGLSALGGLLLACRRWKNPSR